MLSVVVFFSLLQFAFSSDCGNFADDSEDGTCFEVSANATTWVEARAFCQSLGAEVASIHNQQENAFIRRLVVSNGAVDGVFLGGALTGKGNNFAWIDGSNWDYTNFRAGYPMAGAGECLSMDTSITAGEWMNTDCGKAMPVGCARPPVCENGGLTSDGGCLCAEYWTGDSCRTPRCQNGGQPTTDGPPWCVCPDEYGGDVCQFAQCTEDEGVPFSNDYRFLVLIIEMSENTAESIASIADNFQNMIDAMKAKQQDWMIGYFVLTMLDSSGWTASGVPTKTYDNVDRIVRALNQYAVQAKTMKGVCEMPFWSSVKILFEDPLFRAAEVVIVTASTPTDADLVSVQAAMIISFGLRPPYVDVIVVESACQTEEWMQKQQSFYDNISKYGGTMVRAQSGQVGAILVDFLPTRYAPQKLTIQDDIACQQNHIFVQLDTRMTEVYVLVGGEGASFTAIDPIGGQLKPTAIHSSDVQKLWLINPATPGIYKLTISSKSHFCYPAVFGHGGAQVFSGFIYKEDNPDSPVAWPWFPHVNFPVFRLFDSPNYEMLTYKMYVESVSTNTTAFYSFNVDRRLGCNYEYIGQSFTCATKDDMVTVISSGVDNYNQPFSRKIVSRCSDL